MFPSSCSSFRVCLKPLTATDAGAEGPSPQSQWAGEAERLQWTRLVREEGFYQFSSNGQLHM